jgi:hypothetical protein
VVSFAFEGVPLPDVLSRVAREAQVGLAVSPALPVEEWRAHRVTLRMSGVPVRAFLDWLVRPLRAEYAVEADGSVWITRGDDLLLEEPIVARSLRVPTHLTTRRIVRGAFEFRREQKLVLDTLDECLGYLYQRRRGCKLAFHGESDVLVAALPPRGHARLEELLDAMRYGTEPPAPRRPSRAELEGKLASRVACDWDAGPLDKLLAALAERAGVNLGWDSTRLGSPTVAVPRGTRPLREVLDLVAEQTALGAYAVEEGHGLWLYPDGEKRPFPRSGAVPWDRAYVQAYDVRALLRERSPQEVVTALRKQVDPGQWEGGLPAASVFLPTGRLIVVHEEHGHRRVAASLAEMRSRPIKGMEPKDGGP